MGSIYKTEDTVDHNPSYLIEIFYENISSVYAQGDLIFMQMTLPVTFFRDYKFNYRSNKIEGCYQTKSLTNQS